MLPTLRTSKAGLLPNLFFEEWPFDQFAKHLNGGSNGSSSTQFFSTDVTEYPNNYEISIDVPGIAREDIELSMEGTVLTVKVERKEVSNEKSGRSLHRSRWYGSTMRSVTLPEAASSEEVEAELKDGVLTIQVKKQPEKQSRKIEIKSIS